VTDQGSGMVASPSVSGANSKNAVDSLSRCAVCGCTGRWIDPFPPLPRRWRLSRVGGRSKKYVFW